MSNKIDAAHCEKIKLKSIKMNSVSYDAAAL